MTIKVSHLSVCKNAPEFNRYEHELNQLLHDIKSPISSLNLCVRHLENTVDKVDGVEAFPVLKLALDRLNFLVGKSSIVNVFECVSVVESVVSEIQFCSSIGISLEKYSENLSALEIAGNGDVLKTILFNISNNSINASASKLMFSIVEVDSGVIIKVKDNGAGIEKKLINYVGKTGYSFQKSSSISGGQGLGLSHAADTIKSWGGSLTVSSEVNKGTEVSIFLLKK